MAGFTITYTSGTVATAPAISIAAGESLTVTVTLLTSGGAARDCTGGTLRANFDRRGTFGAPIGYTASGDATGIISVTIPAATTRALDGNYVYDVWYEPASGDTERATTVGTFAITPAVGPNANLDPNSILQADIDALQSTIAIVYPTVANARSNADPDASPYLVVLGRGLFAWTTSAGTDSGDELSSYIAATSAGFAFQQQAYVDLDSNDAEPAYREGRVYWANGTLNVMTDNSEVTANLPEENQAPVYNSTASTIADGTPVYASGAQGQRLAVAPAGNGLGVSCRIYGLATHGIESHTNGRITTFGIVHNQNTNSKTAGAPIYTDATAGNITETVVPGDKDGAMLGITLNVNPSQGSYFVNPHPLEQLSGTTANRPTASLRAGRNYYDSTLGYDVTWTGAAWQPAIPSMTIPSAYVELTSPVGTTSATLVDVDSVSTTITLARSAYVIINASFEIQTQSGASASTIGVALLYDSTVETEYQRYLSGSNDQGIGAITARTTLLSAGTHTIKLQFRRVSGVATPGINKADLSAMAMYAAP